MYGPYSRIFGPHQWRGYPTRKEKISRLSEYKASLQNELEGVEERIKELEKKRRGSETGGEIHDPPNF